MYSISEPMRNLIKARDRKIAEMERNFEYHRRIAKYKQESLDTIRAAYVDICKKIRVAILQEQEKVIKKYDQPISQDEINREIIRCGALTSKQLLKKADIIRTSNLPINSEMALVLARELRTRGGKDNVNEADALAIHTETFLDRPWIVNDSYKSLEKLKNQTTVMEANAGEMFVLSLQPQKGDILTIQGTDIEDRSEVPGAAKEQAMREAIKAGVNNFGISS